MAAVTQSRCLAGSKAMRLVQVGQTVKQPSNGAKYFMRRRDSYMVEVRRGRGCTAGCAAGLIGRPGSWLSNWDWRRVSAGTTGAATGRQAAAIAPGPGCLGWTAQWALPAAACVLPGCRQQPASCLLQPATPRAQAATESAAAACRRRAAIASHQVNVADTETEDQAVRRYMKAVVQSGVLNKVRADTLDAWRAKHAGARAPLCTAAAPAQRRRACS